MLIVDAGRPGYNEIHFIALDADVGSLLRILNTDNLSMDHFTVKPLTDGSCSIYHRDRREWHIEKINAALRTNKITVIKQRSYPKKRS